MSRQSVEILPNNGVALFSIPCYTIGVLSSGGGMNLRPDVWIYRNDRITPIAKAASKQIVI